MADMPSSCRPDTLYHLFCKLPCIKLALVTPFLGFPLTGIPPCCHAGQEGSAHEAVVNTIVTSLVYGSQDMLERSIKKTSMEGVEQRVDFAINEKDGKYAGGLLASNDYGAFDSSITDRGHKPGNKGLRGTVERILFDAVFKLIGKYTTHSEKSSVDKKQWEVQFEHFRLLLDEVGRFSGDGLTSIGNYFLTWLVNQLCHIIAACLMFELHIRLDHLDWDKLRDENLSYPSSLDS